MLLNRESFYFNNTILHLEMLRFFIGPYPEFICVFNVVARYMYTLAVFLTWTHMVILRFMYTNVWKNIGYLYDDLILRVRIHIKNFVRKSKPVL